MDDGFFIGVKIHPPALKITLMSENRLFCKLAVFLLVTTLDKVEFFSEPKKLTRNKVSLN